MLCSSACVSPAGCPSFFYVFLRDVVTLWVISVFLSLLIANEGLHWWWLLWLVATLLPVGCLILASSAAWFCAFGMLTCCICGCATKGFVDFLPVLRPPACSGSASPGGFSSPIWFTPFKMGPRRGSRLVCPRLENGLVTIWVRCFGRFTPLRDLRFSWVLRPFSFWMGFEPLSEASLHVLSIQVCFLVVLAEDESLRLSLALSSVLPCPMLWWHVCLHDTCSRSRVFHVALP